MATDHKEISNAIQASLKRVVYSFAKLQAALDQLQATLRDMRKQQPPTNGEPWQ